jgi:hypothetical protein
MRPGVLRAALAILWVAPACSKGEASSGKEPSEPAHEAPPPLPPSLPVASSPPRGDASAPHHGPPAHPVCTLDLSFEPKSLAEVGSTSLAEAIVARLDPKAMRAAVGRDNRGAPVVRDCTGGVSSAVWEEAARGMARPPPQGTIKVIERKAMPDGRQAVWIATAKRIGACAVEDGFGFFAIVGLETSRVDVLGVSPWDPRCRNERKLRAETLAGERVYVEPESEGTGAGTSSWENVWVLRNGKLRVLGRYDTAAEGGEATQTGADDAGVFSPPSFEAKPSFRGDEIVVAGKTQWWRAEAGSALVVVRSEPYERRYVGSGEKLVLRAPP